MKRFVALILLMMCLLQATGASASYFYDYGGTMAKDAIKTTSHQKKFWTGSAHADWSYKNPSNAQVGYNMWYSSNTNYVTNPTIVSSTKDFSISYKSGYGKVDKNYGLAVKNHKDNGYSISVIGTWDP